MSKKSRKKLDADLDVELDEYEPSNSEDAYSEDEKLLLDSVRKGSRELDDESEEEVLGIASDDDDDDGVEGTADGDDASSDLDGPAGEESLPDPKAWGRKKKNFYSTDYVDGDYGGGFQKEEEEEAARMEEEEAREIQRRLASELRDEDFGLGAFVSQDEKATTAVAEVVTSDLSKLSRRQKLTLVEKESPEFFDLTRDFSDKMALLKDELEPVAKLVRDGKIPACNATRFITTIYHLILNYCNNLSFYLLLKALRVPVTTHPVVARLARYRKLLLRAEALYREAVEPQLADVLAADWHLLSPKTTEEKKNKKKKLKILSEPVTNGMSGETDVADEEVQEMTKTKKRKKDEKETEEDDRQLVARLEEGEATQLAAGSSSGEESAAENSEEGDEGAVDGKVDRRAITYEMAKNKGLTPYRKKELRNPRVRHRRKYEKARVRRKGQVREPTKEIKKYGGEISGIKIGVSKSIKLKV